MHIEKEDSHATIFQDTHSKLLQSGHKGLFNQREWRHSAHESYPYTHGKSLWHKRQLAYECRKHLQKEWRNLGQDKIKNYFSFSNFCKSLKT
jgi:hypothetical protein